MAKALPKQVAAALKPIVKTGKGYLPDNGQILSGWVTRPNSTGTFPTYDVSIAKSKIGYKTTPSKPNSKGFRSLVSIFNKNAAASIYERMGKLSPESVFVKTNNKNITHLLRVKTGCKGAFYLGPTMKITAKLEMR